MTHSRIVDGTAHRDSEGGACACGGRCHVEDKGDTTLLRAPAVILEGPSGRHYLTIGGIVPPGHWKVAGFTEVEFVPEGG